ncbi:hypothetical protein [Candidatus Uabimicrobium sp. HlEnr_7]|uniref:hypothetical protein n=1 Tax=Candidatus Uabimicrobium helgolandensis TaxID=3095367 RepID=UPI0035585951
MKKQYLCFVLLSIMLSVISLRAQEGAVETWTKSLLKAEKEYDKARTFITNIIEDKRLENVLLEKFQLDSKLKNIMDFPVMKDFVKLLDKLDKANDKVQERLAELPVHTSIKKIAKANEATKAVFEEILKEDELQTFFDMVYSPGSFDEMRNQLLADNKALDTIDIYQKVADLWRAEPDESLNKKNLQSKTLLAILTHMLTVYIPDNFTKSRYRFDSELQQAQEDLNTARNKVLGKLKKIKKILNNKLKKKQEADKEVKKIDDKDKKELKKDGIKKISKKDEKSLKELTDKKLSKNDVWDEAKKGLKSITALLKIYAHEVDTRTGEIKR